MADEVTTQETAGGNTEHVVKLITEPVNVNQKAVGEDDFDEAKYLSLHQRYAPQIEKTLGIDQLKERLTAAEQREAAKDMENAKLKAQNTYNFTDEELAEIPGDNAAQFAAAAAVAGKYKLAAQESSKVIEDARSRGTMPSELGGATSPDVPKEGTPEWNIYQLQKAQGLVK